MLDPPFYSFFIAIAFIGGSLGTPDIAPAVFVTVRSFLLLLHRADQLGRTGRGLLTSEEHSR